MSLTEKRFPLIKAQKSRSQLSLVTAQGGCFVGFFFKKKQLTKNKYHTLA